MHLKWLFAAILCHLGEVLVLRQVSVLRNGVVPSTALAANKTHFLHVREVWVATGRADLVLELNFTHLHSQLLQTCSVTKTLLHSANPEIGKFLSEICHEDLEEWREGVELLAIPAETRVERFVATAIVATLAAGIGGWIWGSTHSTSQAARDLKDNQDHLVSVLRSMEH